MDEHKQKTELHGLLHSIFGRKPKTDDLQNKAGSQISSLFENTAAGGKERSGQAKEAAAGAPLAPAPGRNRVLDKMLKLRWNMLFRPQQKISGLGYAGLDIGTSSIKALQFKSVGAKRELVSLAVEEFSPKDYEGPEREKAQKQMLLKLKQLGKLNGPCVVAFNDPELSVELMRLPQMPQAELLNAIKWELKERYSFDEEISVFDYAQVGEAVFEGEKQQEILIIIFPRKKIIRQLEILNSAGIKAAAIEPMPMAVFESFEDSIAWKPEEVVAILDIGAKFTSINFVKNNMLYFSRISQVCGESMTKAIADYCQMEYDLAEHHKKEYGISKMALEADRKTPDLAGEVRVKIAHALGLHLEQLYSEIERSFRFFSYEVCAEPVEKIDRFTLCGGGARLKNFPNFLSARFNVPVEIANPLAQIQAKGEKFDLDYLRVVATSFSASVGLALRKKTQIPE